MNELLKQPYRSKKKQLDEYGVKLSRQEVSTGVGFATRNYLGAQ
jgi:hypothetical protein